MSLLEKKSKYSPTNSDYSTYTGPPNYGKITKGTTTLGNAPGYESNSFLTTQNGELINQPSSRYNAKKTYLDSIQTESKI